MSDLQGKTLLISGGSRGIGLAIAVKAAADGANVALVAKTAEPHPKLEGTIFTAAEAIEEAGGQALPIVGDVRDDASVEAAVEATVERFGGIDILVNNASAIDLSDPESLSMKRYDLMQSINARGSFLLSKLCVPHLRKGSNSHVLTLSPPLSMDPKWFGQHPAYTMSKYGMSMVTLGFAERYREEGIAFNSLWPRTLIATAAVEFVVGGDAAMKRARTPQIMADAAYEVLTTDSSNTGNFYIDDEVLLERGVDLAQYSSAPEADLQIDIFVEERE
ncbi:MAG TPA: NAD(P)-dependent oxidoreductase [Solirubrobacterales bacterium]|nr:NAD(P)-dependent oxidoreductase [Solirubrobacterales bacterium]